MPLHPLVDSLSAMPSTSSECNLGYGVPPWLVVLLRSLLSVHLTFLATSRYRASSTCFVRLVALLMPLLFSGAIALLFLWQL